jgi:hypothetical protein
VNLQSDVFLPWLGMEMKLADDLVPVALNVVIGQNVTAVMSLEQMWSRLLALPPQTTVPEADVNMPMTEILQEPPPIFSAEEQSSVRDFLRAELYAPRRLEELLVAAGEWGLTSAAKRLFVLLTLQQFGAVGDQLQFHVRPIGSSLSCDPFVGDDLELSRL